MPTQACAASSVPRLLGWVLPQRADVPTRTVSSIPSCLRSFSSSGQLLTTSLYFRTIYILTRYFNSHPTADSLTVSLAVARSAPSATCSPTPLTRLPHSFLPLLPAIRSFRRLPSLPQSQVRARRRAAVVLDPHPRRVGRALPARGDVPAVPQGLARARSRPNGPIGRRRRRRRRRGRIWR